MSYMKTHILLKLHDTSPQTTAKERKEKNVYETLKTITEALHIISVRICFSHVVLVLNVWNVIPNQVFVHTRENLS